MKPSEKLTWRAEVAPFTQNSPIAIVKVIGVNPDGKQCEKVILVGGPVVGEEPDPILKAKWVNVELDIDADVVQ